ncbi:hypothetical protein HC251_17605 [Iamia sp. SCSIO 61187]|uniref:hypothetical protein n=1 Tax=Iamia sp. SCSIO 61187 TaxID=2722752 RepID=UPI001C638D34|nr:hypothetical protein [Iamia sp. SCSIO 61187]QYG94074.1 hypothetical protein HC251_17605 [Iamia sp. SCSIO 61187]
MLKVGTRPTIALRLLVAGAVLTGLVGCQPEAQLPGRHGAATPPLVYVYGDSLTPLTDYRQQAAASGYALVGDSQGGSWMCGGHTIPQSDGTRWWPRIVETITEVKPDFVVLQYQAWANYELRCGGRPEQFPFDPADPGRAWRVYLQMFVDAAAAAGAPTRLVVVESPSAPASMPEWGEPMRIMDQASRVMAARRPERITFVPIRHETTIDGRWTPYVPCQPYDPGYRTDPSVSCWDSHRSADWPAGQVRIRSGDRIHHWCPSGNGICDVSSPAGLRIRRAVFTTLNDLVAGRR